MIWNFDLKNIIKNRLIQTEFINNFVIIIKYLFRNTNKKK